jgi:hypothetical protein
MLTVLAHGLSSLSTDLGHVLAISTDSFAASRSYGSHMLAVPTHGFASLSRDRPLLLGTHGCKSTIGSFLFLLRSFSFHHFTPLISRQLDKKYHAPQLPDDCVDNLKQSLHLMLTWFNEECVRLSG